MKMHVYILIATLSCLYGFFTELEVSTKPESNSKTKDLHGFSDLLLSDYIKLASFSEKLKGYGITEESFEYLFWEGVSKSRNFYSSSKYIHQSPVNHWIEKELLTHVDLGHPLEKPEISTTDIKTAFSALNNFSGEWHGKWKTIKVNHLWLPVQKHKSDLTDGFSVVGFQSCFTGDGFGWNYVVKEKNRIFVLGFVYHFDAAGKIVSKNPHYAFVNPKNQLTWVSDNHIYYEFVCGDSKCAEKKHYVITGAKYEKRRKEPALVSGFQAIYLPQDQKLPEFKHLYFKKLNEAKRVLSKKLETLLKKQLQKNSYNF